MVELRRVVMVLLVGALVTSMTTVLLAGLATLLGWLGDHRAAAAVTWVAIGVGVIWIVDLIGLVLAVGIGYTLGSNRRSGPGRTFVSEEADQNVSSLVLAFDMDVAQYGCLATFDVALPMPQAS